MKFYFDNLRDVSKTPVDKEKAKDIIWCNLLTDLAGRHRMKREGRIEMKEEWKSILSSTWIKIVLIAIMIIPMAYAGIFLGSMWDPYGNADKIPVAVVNQDKAVQYNGANLHIGDDLVENLKENKAMDFHFVNQKEAAEGLSNGSYYMVITIPEKFSKNATTLLNEHPEKMELSYATNPGTNYIASKMDETAIRKIKESVSASVTMTYADTLFSQVKTLSSGLNDAGDGSTQLKNGVEETIAGNDTMTQSLLTLASSTLTFKDGTKELTDGLYAYTDGVRDVQGGAKDLSEGMNTLQTQSTTLINGMDTLQKGSTKLKVGVDKYTAGASDVADGLDTLVQNNDTLNNGVAKVSLGSKQVQAGSEQILNGLNTMSYSLSTLLNEENKQKIASLIDQTQVVQTKNTSFITALEQKVQAGTASDMDIQLLQLLQANNAYLENDSNMIQTMQTALLNVQDSLDRNGTTPETTGLIQGMTNLHDGVVALNQGINGEKGLKNGVNAYTAGTLKVQQGSAKLVSTSADMQSGANELQQGTVTMNSYSPSLANGVQQLNDGSKALYDGTSALVRNNPTLLQGAIQLTNGSSLIHSGATKLADGSTTLGNGLVRLKDGSIALASSLKDGAEKSNLRVSEQTKEMLAQPLDVKHEEVSTVESNGKAMAPYMMSVGLYVACMAFTLMYPLLKNNSKTKSGFKLWLHKASVMYALSTVMAAVMILALTLINGLSPLQFLKTLAIACLISAAFMSMIVFFNISFGKIGAFLVLIFMVFQLGGAAGTYPIETSNGFYQAIHPYMPFTYSVDAFRHTLALGGSILPDIMVFIGMIIVFSCCSILFYRWKVSISEEQFEKTKLAQFH